MTPAPFGGENGASPPVPHTLHTEIHPPAKEREQMDQHDGALRRRHHSDENVLIMPGAQVVGNVTFTGPECSVWHNAVIRGGPEGITIGRRTNIQDCAVLHTDDGAPCTVGEDVTIGHGAVVHACTVGDRVLIGMGAVVLTGAVIGSD